MIEIHFGGHLSFYSPGKKPRLSYPLTSPTNLRTILEQFHVPVAEIALVIINGEAADRVDVDIKPGDRVDLFSPMSGG